MNFWNFQNCGANYLSKKSAKENKTEKISMKIASSDTKENLLKLINKYYYTENCIIQEDNQVVNTKLKKTLGKVEVKGKRFNYVV